MLTRAAIDGVASNGSAGAEESSALPSVAQYLRSNASHLTDARAQIPRLGSPRASGSGLPMVRISPSDATTRHRMDCPGMAAEIVQTGPRGRINFRFRAPVHLLVVYDRGARHDGETHIEGLPASTLRQFARKLTLVPAGREYREWLKPSAASCLMFLYFDAISSSLGSDNRAREVDLTPRLFFEDASVFNTALKLKALVESPTAGDMNYVEAIGAVLLHELVRLDRGSSRLASFQRGGLASWQERVVAAHIEDHMGESISLAALAALVHLSPYHFCRSFKRSFGMPPRRYLANRRIERAKEMLARRTHSVTDIGFAVGFSDTSSFSAAFHKATGMPPTAYQRRFS